MVRLEEPTVRSLLETLKERDKEIKFLKEQRRERIATAAMSGLMYRLVEYREKLGQETVKGEAVVTQLAIDSIRAADALMRELEYVKED